VLDREALALMALGFRRVYSQNSTAQTAAKSESPSNGPQSGGTHVPYAIKCWCSRPLCTGYSKRTLPFYEIVSGPAFLRCLRHAYYVNKGAQRAAAIG